MNTGRNKNVGTEKKRKREKGDKLRKPKLGPENNEREEMRGGRGRGQSRGQGTRKDLEGAWRWTGAVYGLCSVFGKLLSVGSSSYPKGRCTVTSFWHL